MRTNKNENEFRDNLVKATLIYISVFLISTQLQSKVLFIIMKTTLKLIGVALGFTGVVLYLIYSIALAKKKREDLKNKGNKKPKN
ncbi:MAG: hypothetical protein PF569_10280 [Candidatus Woesearchaeota archaeon]|jgi:hypothetical protein|nr:hypothetical protein [Candidatus Woesearchaeota archaeon]